MASRNSESVSFVAFWLVIIGAGYFLYAKIFADPPATPMDVGTQASTLPSPPSTKEEARIRISDGVFLPYTRDEYPKLFAKLGRAAQRIQPAREGAAYSALNSGRCDRVRSSEASDRSMPEGIVIFVDCENGERFYLDEAQIAQGVTAQTQSDKTIDRASAILACSSAAKAVALHPSLVDAHTWTGATFSSDRTTGNALVRLNFDATNAFGVEVPYTALCNFAAGSPKPTISVVER